MFDKKGQELISKFKTLTDFLEEVAESGDENAALILEELNSFGRLLVDYVLECSNEISKLNAQKVESEEEVKKLKEKLEALEKAVPKQDIRYYSAMAQKTYAAYWDLMTEETCFFLSTAYYLKTLLRAQSVDFSVVVIELTKSIENEMSEKLYLPYLRSIKKPLAVSGAGKFIISVNAYLNDGSFFIPFKIMFTALRKPLQKHYDYYKDLEHYVNTHGWKTNIICSSDFIELGAQYAEGYRNDAAHTEAVSESVVQNCQKDSIRLMKMFLSAYPKK